MSAQSELRALLENYSPSERDWVRGKVPTHYRRLTLTREQADEYAAYGAMMIGSYFGQSLFYTQSLIAGVILQRDFHKLYIVTPSQYGKSWLLGMVGLLNAYLAHPTFIAGSTIDLTGIIMGYTVKATQFSAPELQDELLVQKSQLEKLNTALSKTKIAFRNGGSIEPLTLGDTFTNSLAQNKALGRSGDYFVDEAALVSDKALSELGRTEFSNVDAPPYQIIQISNPHNPGTFWDTLNEENLPKDTVVIWMDALTAVEEERFSVDQVLSSEFFKRKDTCKRYLLCELDLESDSMFDTPKVYDEDVPKTYPPTLATVHEEDQYKQYFLGVDAAYKGVDKIDMALFSVTTDENGDALGLIEEISTIPTPPDWIDGVTGEEICDQIARVARHFYVPMVAVDIGWGVWLVEGLNKRGIYAKGVNFGESPTKGRVAAHHYAAVNAVNKRAEMHLDLQNLIEGSKIWFEKDAFIQIKDILPFVSAERKSNGKLQIVPKSTIKRHIGHSPDALDSVLLAIHANILFNGEELA